ncbi:hypothetical protein BsIDN1_54470 [Bacillus safensis]|uniref:Bacteriophage SP-beta YorD domain-containing protein n=1 Tax=Bacillus safensis TaxID=561879 RepID=A0A5S9MJ23_BACIA|nr:hypothetical protein BsIDN1_54470 [Bacillus safensis]
MILYEAIKYKYPDADPQKDFELRNDGAGSYIDEWYLDVPKPTEKELKKKKVGGITSQSKVSTTAPARLSSTRSSKRKADEKNSLNINVIFYQTN